ncbi:hypothetical protein WJX72_005281 [[Myrmecia] bisecta]|uniref:Uncharacterized protein n=1 Tax=[Myrmecia] bisecta TaxID=41462 RepID=A0AAW1QBV7_9CHLO
MSSEAEPSTTCQLHQLLKDETLAEAYLGYLTGQLSTGPVSLELEFAGEHSILGLGCFQQASFLELLSPMLTALRLDDLRFQLVADELAALGQLRQLTGAENLCRDK